PAYFFLLPVLPVLVPPSATRSPYTTLFRSRTSSGPIRATVMATPNILTLLCDVRENHRNVAGQLADLTTLCDAIACVVRRIRENTSYDFGTHCSSHPRLRTRW